MTVAVSPNNKFSFSFTLLVELRMGLRVLKLSEYLLVLYYYYTNIYSIFSFYSMYIQKKWLSKCVVRWIGRYTREFCYLQYRTTIRRKKNSGGSNRLITNTLSFGEVTGFHVRVYVHVQEHEQVHVHEHYTKVYRNMYANKYMFTYISKFIFMCIIKYSYM
jgi:hypothetical protein